MKKTALILISLLALNLVSCQKSKQYANNGGNFPEPVIEELPDGFLSFTSEELRFVYPETYKVENSDDGKRIIILGENGHIMLFKASDYSEDEIADFQIPVEETHIGREVYGFEVYLYYTEPVESEIKEILSSMKVLQSYRNRAHRISLIFPQDWYFNFEDNNLNCMSPYGFGQINKPEACKDALLQMKIFGSLDAARESISDLKVNQFYESHKVGGFDSELTFHYIEDQDSDALVYVFEFNGKGLAFHLKDSAYSKEAEEIIASII